MRPAGKSAAVAIDVPEGAAVTFGDETPTVSVCHYQYTITSPKGRNSAHYKVLLHLGRILPLAMVEFRHHSESTIARGGTE